MSGPGEGRSVSSAPRPTEGAFDSFASALVRRLGLLPSLNFPCPQCYTSSVVELAFASRPVEGPAVASPVPPSNAEAEEETQHPPDAAAVLENDSANHPEAANVKKTGVSGNSPARVNSTMAASSCCNVAGAENSNGQRATKPVYKFKRKSKNGEALELTMADISPLFHLQLPIAAKQLGISMTSLKKICRDNGIDRWPGRKIRGLQSTIDGIERTIVGQGADSGNLKAASMRAAIPELKQDLKELYHGNSAQITKKMHSPAVTTANAYKRLYYMRHRDAEAKKQPGRNRKLRAPRTDDDDDDDDDDAPGSQSTPNADTGNINAYPGPRKSILSRPRGILRSSSRLRWGSRNSDEMNVDDIEGLLREVHGTVTNMVSGRVVPAESVVIVQAQNGSNNST